MGSPTPLAPVLSRFWDDPKSWTLETYQRTDLNTVEYGFEVKLDKPEAAPTAQP